LSEDIFAVKPVELLKTKVTMTMLGGKVVFSSGMSWSARLPR
jgi:predicted amidohydrolase YtcJ